jgi:tripartite-type tricarboxylate transporter receptor subunit TctC
LRFNDLWDIYPTNQVYYLSITVILESQNLLNMKITMRSLFIRLFCLVSISFGFLSFAYGQTFPNKPIRVIVPFGPGGVADLTARIVAQKMGTVLGQSMVIENKPSAGGIVAGETVAKSEPDGYTILLMSNGTAISASLFQKLPFDPVKDFEALSTLGFFDIAIVVDQGSPFHQLKDLTSKAQSQPGKLNIASINIGSTQNLAAELFKSTANMDVQVIPFNGTPAVITALRGGQVDAAVEILAPMVPQIQSKSIRLLAVTGAKRSSFFPEVPTASESGLKSFNASSWNGFAVPAGTPPSVIQTLNRSILTAISDPEVRSKLQAIYVEPQSSSPKEMKTLLENDIKRWGKVIEQAHIPKQ